MACGPGGLLGLRFRPDGSHSVAASFRPRPEWQGYAGILHGGMISTLLDAAMTHCLFHHEVEAMTASLKVRFLEPAPCAGLLDLRATLSDRRRHVYLLARAEARFITSPVAHRPSRGKHHGQRD